MNNIILSVPKIYNRNMASPYKIQDNVTMNKEMLRKWLAAGYIDKGRWNPTEKGTPQVG